MDLKSVLFFGGNGFLGSQVLAYLLQENVKVVLINRGNKYWDSDSLIKPNVININWDRTQSLQNCMDFQEILKTIPYFDAIIDFSLYSVEGLHSVISFLNGKFGIYIYISSDSVYEVCVKNHNGPTTEKDAVRPETQEQQKQLNDLDPYGHNKLECEEYLQNAGVSYVFIRIPDIIGPHDTTRRWWVYQMWVQFYEEIGHPLIISPSVENRLLSLSYTQDIAKVIYNILKTPNLFMNQAFNIALKENFTLKQMLLDIAEELNVKNIEFIIKEFDNNYQLFPDTVKDNFLINYNKLYPTVNQGIVDIRKAETIVNFKPTPWKQALKECVKFYKEALKTFPTERDSVMNLLLKDIVPKENQAGFKNAILKYK